METPRQTLATIVATIGPASQSEDTVRRLILGGVNVFRFNFSHGTPEDHAARARVVREISADLGRHVAIMGDLPGPKIRVSRVPDSGIWLEPGQDVILDPGLKDATPAAGATPAMLGCTVEGIDEAVSPGHKVLINDGAIRLLSVERAPSDPAGSIRCRVMVGGLVTTGKGINFPMSQLRVPALTDRDRQWVQWAIEQRLDFLALSFVRSAGEIIELKSILAKGADTGPDSPGPIPVIAKIEKPQAVEAIESIVQASDGIMVARGDLGVETDAALVPVIQKRVVAAAGRFGKPCIVATQMLESMIESATPTRAEASDVANAIFDGADAVMLSGETAIGKHPTLVVETMKRVVAAAEAFDALSRTEPSPSSHDLATGHRTAALSLAAFHAARGVAARAVAVWSQRGGSARHLSQTGFQIPIIAYSSAVEVTRRMQLLRGVIGRCEPVPDSLAEWNALVVRDIRDLDLCRDGDAVILVAGLPLGVQGSPNTIAFYRLGENVGGFLGAG
ncbi:MAG: pyruvate kinase [Phycisphaerales bacterium]